MNTDYTCYGTSELIERIHELEAKQLTSNERSTIVDELGTKIEEYENFHDVEESYIKTLKAICTKLK